MAKQHNLKPALESVRDFIGSLSPSERLTRPPQFGLSFGAEGEGALFLNELEAQQYRSVLEALVDAVRSSGQVSPRAVEKAFQQTILAALDLKNRQPETPDVRLKNAISELRSTLTALPQTFRVYRRVNGLAVDGLPSRVGNVEFLVFDDQELDRLRATVGEHADSEEERELRYQMVDELQQKKEIAGCTVGILEIAALDSGAAQALAAGELRRTLDVINFYSDLYRTRLFGQGAAQNQAAI